MEDDEEEDDNEEGEEEDDGEEGEEDEDDDDEGEGLPDLLEGGLWGRCPHIENDELQDEEQIIHLDSIVQVEREDCDDGIRLLDVLRLAEALCMAEVDEDAAT